MSSNINSENTDGKASDLFTRLNIRIWEGDNAIRPVHGQDWWESQDNAVGYKSPDITFSNYPVPANQNTDINIKIHNYGTMDCVDGFLETAYNLWIGNESQGNVPISTVPIPTIAAGGFVDVTVPWTPPNTESTHGCIHARVIDTYSMLHYTQRSYLWNSFENPQAGNRNVQLIRITQPNHPLVVRFKARNFFNNNINAKILVVKGSFDRRTAVSDRFPLPFAMSVPNLRHISRTHLLDNTTRIKEKAYPSLNRNFRLSSGRRILNDSTGGLFPTDKIDPKLIHNRFGIDTQNRIRISGNRRRIARDHFFTKDSIRRLRKKSFHRLNLSKGSVSPINVIIPPDEFPTSRGRQTFVIHYQIGNARPVEHILYLYR